MYFVFYFCFKLCEQTRLILNIIIIYTEEAKIFNKIDIFYQDETRYQPKIVYQNGRLKYSKHNSCLIGYNACKTKTKNQYYSYIIFPKPIVYSTAHVRSAHPGVIQKNNLFTPQYVRPSRSHAINNLWETFQVFDRMFDYVFYQLSILQFKRIYKKRGYFDTEADIVNDVTRITGCLSTSQKCALNKITGSHSNVLLHAKLFFYF